MAASRARLICLPTRDSAFADTVHAVMSARHDIVDPPGLAAALQKGYPDVLVRASELSGLRTPTWYVYRDGHFPWSDT
jgi:hypothetical protein